MVFFMLQDLLVFHHPNSYKKNKIHHQTKHQQKNLRSPPLKAWRYQALQLDPCFENCSVVFRHSVSASWNGLAQGDLNPPG